MAKRKPSKAKYQWVYDPPKAAKPKVPEETKRLVQEKFDEIIETLYKPTYIKPPPTDHDFNYLVDLYGKWYRNYFYICGTYNCPSPRAIAPSFEHRFSRYEYVGADQFNVAYMRHTDKWWEFLQGLTLEQCLEEARTNAILQPY
ncbi:MULTISPECIES: hypothetical protein [unclassified Leptolyngbya]|uniref:DUF3024 domain-containing protein n=1 Tax=unclassified Leptolyngbya TaxID=2650499 RepID=UPI0016823ED0|nr:MULTISPECIES: hypothetical protein [unclassified Leptolyngbya]MBD1911953.1 hypothetical protein [Leptolyngbya sp. FACHB-8]MBD2154254.1 hypothetical protein [Leptolyngbya sp. FACHB-16]